LERRPEQSLERGIGCAHLGVAAHAAQGTALIRSFSGLHGASLTPNALRIKGRIVQRSTPRARYALA
jgi:hypothetical protein